MNNLDNEFPEPHMDKPIQPPIVGQLRMVGKIDSKDNQEQMVNQLSIMADMVNRIAELESMLRKHEWDSGREFDECPECHESFAHTDYCQLNKLLTSK